MSKAIEPKLGLKSYSCPHCNARIARSVQHRTPYTCRTVPPNTRAADELPGELLELTRSRFGSVLLGPFNFVRELQVQVTHHHRVQRLTGIL